MPRDEGTLPEEGLLLCESCGYILTGLPRDSHCPECGRPLAESLPELRQLPDWEREDDGRHEDVRFWRTSAAVLFHPSRFYRSLATRVDRKRSRLFARSYRFGATLFLGWTGSLQLLWLFGLVSWTVPPFWARRIYDLSNTGPIRSGLFLAIIGFVPCALLASLSLLGMTHLVARLTAWEARQRKLRLPHHVILRGLDYHSPHYLPVALMALLTVGGYQLLLAAGILSDLSGPTYLLILCLEAPLAGIYLFRTYWIAMRNMMFANR